MAEQLGFGLLFYLLLAGPLTQVTDLSLLKQLGTKRAGI